MSQKSAQVVAATSSRLQIAFLQFLEQKVLSLETQLETTQKVDNLDTNMVLTPVRSLPACLAYRNETSCERDCHRPQLSLQELHSRRRLLNEYVACCYIADEDFTDSVGNSMNCQCPIE